MNEGDSGFSHSLYSSKAVSTKANAAFEARGKGAVSVLKHWQSTAHTSTSMDSRPVDAFILSVQSWVLVSVCLTVNRISLSSPHVSKYLQAASVINME